MNPLASTAESDAPLARALQQPYRHGFVTEIERLAAAGAGRRHGARHLAAQAQAEFLLKWRLQAFERWQAMPHPDWAQLRLTPPDFRAQSYYSAPKSLSGAANAPASLAEVDPKLLETYHEKLGVPLHGARGWPAWRSTRCSTRSRWAPPSASSWRASA